MMTTTGELVSGGQGDDGFWRLGAIDRLRTCLSWKGVKHEGETGDEMEDRKDEKKSRWPVHCDATPTLDYILLCFSRQRQRCRARERTLDDHPGRRGHGLQVL